MPWACPRRLVALDLDVPEADRGRLSVETDVAGQAPLRACVLAHQLPVDERRDLVAAESELVRVPRRQVEGRVPVGDGRFHDDPPLLLSRAVEEIDLLVEDADRLEVV